MRSALLFVLFAIITIPGTKSAPDDGFRPTPIPLSYWSSEEREGRAGSLQPHSPDLPAHYWEDALRHSVYLTLVRDKIDQLIAKAEMTSSEYKPSSDSKEDDHDLWDRVKKAPFYRVQEEEPDLFSDVAVISKGKLIKVRRELRFVEEELTKENCKEKACMEGVWALWSVTRMRQKESDNTGRYHYELTFSVVTQKPKKHNKPHGNPTRTFTVKETDKETIEEQPLENRYYEPVRTTQAPPRAERAIWFHKNIYPVHQQGRQYQQGLDRIFSSLFSDDDDYAYVPRHKPPPQYQPVSYTQYSKVGYVGASSDNNQQKRLMPYPYKPNQMKYTRPLPPPPTQHQHHYSEENPGGPNNMYVPQFQDHKYIQGKPMKSVRPPVLLPTPLPPLPPLPQKNVTVPIETTTDNLVKGDVSDSTTVATEIVTNYNKPKPTPVRVNYFADHVRPPVFNAPPGVFVTMDKKPFKPLPPMRLHSSKPMRSHRPVDFRPSPQIHDVQFADPDPMLDNAFRPIAVTYGNVTTENISTEKVTTGAERIRPPHKSKRPPIETVESPKLGYNNDHKPPKKHEHKKLHAPSTSAPDIITAASSFEDSDEDIHVVNVLGALAKTTPMEPEIVTEVVKKVPQKPTTTTTTTTSTTTTTTTTTTPKPTTVKSRRYTTTTEKVKETTTTPAPKKRTRPPHKFIKPEKPKKHKRVTSTTTKAPEKSFTKYQNDLTPQASSAAAIKPSTKWAPSSTTTHEPMSTSTSTTTTRKPTTTTTVRATTTTTTTEPPTTTTTTEPPPPITEKPKNKNRYRQSTLMQKGTSVNHDKWSIINLEPGNQAKIRTALPVTLPDGRTGNFPPRRKGSNFQGYITSSTSKSTDYEEEDYEELEPSVAVTEAIKKSVVSESYSAKQEVEDQKTTKAQTTAESNHETTADDNVNETDGQDEREDNHYYNNETEAEPTEITEQRVHEEEQKKDQAEFMFYTKTTEINEKANEIAEQEEQQPTTTETVIVTTKAAPKKKCKRKKSTTTTTTTESMLDEFEEESEEEEESQELPTTTTPATTTTTTSSTTPDLLDELFGGFTYDEQEGQSTNENKATAKPDLQDIEEDESESQDTFTKEEDQDFEDFLDELEEKYETKQEQTAEKESTEKDSEEESEDDDSDEEEDDSVAAFSSEEGDKDESKEESDEDPEARSAFSLFELMAME